MSRLHLARPAVRGRMPARVLISGPPGAQALEVGLDLAHRFADRTVVVDASEGTSLDLADRWTFDVVRWTPPYLAPDLIELLGEAEQGSAVVIDHLSAWWHGAGGLRDLGHAGNWETVRGQLSNLARAILGCRAHVVCLARCRLRSATAVLDGVETTHTVTEGPELDSQLIYPFPLHLHVEHGIRIEHSRLPGHPEALDSAEIAAWYGEWIDAGAATVDQVDADALTTSMALPDAKERRDLKRDFAASFGRPDHLPVDHLAEAQAFIERHTKGAA